MEYIHETDVQPVGHKPIDKNSKTEYLKLWARDPRQGMLRENTDNFVSKSECGQDVNANPGSQDRSSTGKGSDRHSDPRWEDCPLGWATRYTAEIAGWAGELCFGGW